MKQAFLLSTLLVPTVVASACSSGPIAVAENAGRDAGYDAHATGDAEHTLDVIRLGGPDGACPYQDFVDHDGDGWSFEQGDCNDCDPTINPGAYDIPGDHIDEDCDGIPDDEPMGCDSTVTLESSDPVEGARAIDICRQTTEGATGRARTWGLISAAYMLPDGTTTTHANFSLGYGLLPALGVNRPRQGAAMLGLSSGSARGPKESGYHDVSGFDKGFTSAAPPPYPKEAPACPGIVFGQPHDGTALELVIRVPTNAKTLSFNENYFTFEFPDYVCSVFNDTFVVTMSPKTDPALPDTNIAFDSMGNPISVNNALLQVCSPQEAGTKTYSCPLGTSSLDGTGFGQTDDDGPHAATGWLTTTAPVESIKGKDVTLRFAIWDSTDGIFDSSVLVDNLTWGFTKPTAHVTTTPTPPPK